MQLMNAGDFGSAIAIYSRLLDDPSTSAEEAAGHLVNRAVSYGGLRQVEAELADYERVLEMPEAPLLLRGTALANRSAVWLRLGQWDNAIADGNRAIELTDDIVPVASSLMNQGIAFCENGQKSEAINAYTAVLSLSRLPDKISAEALLERGVNYLAVGDTEEAMVDFTAVGSLAQANPFQYACALCYRACCLSKCGRRAEASADAQAALGYAALPPKLRSIALQIFGAWNGSSS